MAYLAGVRETRAVRQWAEGERDIRNAEDEQRLRIAYQAALLITEKDDGPWRRVGSGASTRNWMTARQHGCCVSWIRTRAVRWCWPRRARSRLSVDLLGAGSGDDHRVLSRDTSDGRIELEEYEQ